MKDYQTFRDRIIDSQLDSDRKPFRKVYKAGNEVIILYNAERTPQSMLGRLGSAAFPLEWLYYEKYSRCGDGDYPEWMNSFGLPLIHELGIDQGNPYIIEEYLEGLPMRTVMDDVKDEEWWETFLSMSSFLATCSDRYTLFGNDGLAPMITPDNLYFAGIDAENPGYGGMALKFIGIDGIFFPEYQDPTLLKYFDGRFLYPWKQAGAKNHACFSLARSLIQCLREEVPEKEEDIAKFICEQPFTAHQAVSLHRCLLSPLFQPRAFEGIFETEETRRSRLAPIAFKWHMRPNNNYFDYNRFDLC